MQRNIVVLLGVCFMHAAMAQTPAEELNKYKQKYANHNAIFTKMYKACNIVVKNKKLVVVTNVSEEMMILNEKGAVNNSRTVYSDSFRKITNLKAASHLPEEKKYKTKAVDNFEEKSNMGEYSFYDDGKSTEFVYPGVAEGVKMSLDYTETLEEARFFGQQFLANYLPVDEVKYSITFPKGVSLEYKLFNTEKTDITFTKEESKSTTTYTWVCKNTPSIKIEDNAPGIRYYVPHIIAYIKEFQNGKVNEQYLNGVQGLYNWYVELVKRRNSTSDEAYLKNIVDSVTLNAKTNLEKAEMIFDFVENKIRYIAFEDGLGGFIPRDATSVCQKRFGDCKDMANLLNELMHLAGLKSYLTWIGTRDIPYTYEEVPTMASDNHMILTLEDENKKLYFLDATGKDHPFGMHTSMIQGKEALIGISDTEYRIEKIPEMPYEKTVGYDSMKVILNEKDDVLQTNGALQFNGYEKLSLIALKSVPYDDKIKFLRGYLQKGNNKFTIDTAMVNDLGKHNPMTVTYTGKIPDYVKRNKNELYINLQFQKGITKMLVDGDNRTAPIEHDFRHREINYVEFKIPDGYKVTYLPPALTIGNDKYSSKISYEVKNNTIIMQRDFIMNTLMLYPNEFTDWNAYVKKLASGMNESIVLTKQ